MAKPQKINLHKAARKAMEQYGFEPDFPPEVLDEIKALGMDVKVDVEPGCRDLRHLLWSSIDNFDSKDLDQIEYCEKNELGEINVKVAIADVGRYVPKGSDLDKYAANNTASIYTGVVTFPMLHQNLSENLSSLAVDEDRYAIVADFNVSSSGLIQSVGVYHAVVRNKAKLVYEVIGRWLEGKTKTPDEVVNILELEEQILLQDRVSQILGESRFKRGALELNTLEAMIISEGDTVLDLVVVEEDKAKAIIENFMIAANGVVSEFLENAGVPIIQRVVRTPRDWEGIVAVAKSYGTKLPSKPDANELSSFLIKQKKADSERFPDLSLTMVKLLGAGEYVFSELNKPNIGHFCLAVSDYTHSTAPNRRYVDLIIQRLLEAVLNNNPTPYTKKELEEIAVNCTEKEKSSKKVERLMKKIAATTLLTGKIGEKFDGIITNASQKGTYVRVFNPPTEGRVMRNSRGLKVGKKVTVKLIKLDQNRGYIDFEVVGKKRK